MTQYTDEQFLNATTAVKLVTGYEENEAGGLTPNEFKIINHYENLLNDRLAVSVKTIEKTAYDISDFARQLDFIQNYLSLLSALYENKHKNSDLAYLHIALFEDGALINFDRMLKNGSKLLDRSCNALLSVIDGEE